MDRDMERNFIKWLVNTIAIMVAIKFVPGIVYTGEWWGILVVGLIFGLINTFIRPFIKLFALPLLILSLGLFTFIINAMMLSLTSWLSDHFISVSMWKVSRQPFGVFAHQPHKPGAFMPHTFGRQRVNSLTENAG